MSYATFNTRKTWIAALVAAGGLALCGAPPAQAADASAGPAAATPAQGQGATGAASGIDKMDAKDKKLVQENRNSSDRALEQNQQARAAAGSGDFIVEQEQSQTLAGNVIGTDLHESSADGKSIGKVSDLILNDQQQLVGVVVGVGGFLGIGEKDVGIPWSQIKDIDVEKHVAVVDMTKEQLQEAPTFRSKEAQKKQAEQEERAAGAAQQTGPANGGGAVPPGAAGGAAGSGAGR